MKWSFRFMVPIFRATWDEVFGGFHSHGSPKMDVYNIWNILKTMSLGQPHFRKPAGYMPYQAINEIHINGINGPPATAISGFPQIWQCRYKCIPICWEGSQIIHPVCVCVMVSALNAALIVSRQCKHLSIRKHEQGYKIIKSSNM